MSEPLKIIFAGTPEFGVPCLNAIIQENLQLEAIYTQPDRPAGRGRSIQHSAIKDWGIKHNIPIYQPENFKNPETIATLQALKPDLMVVIAYGLILPKQVLDIPQFGCINVHASILPRWRGASPIQHAILYGDEKTGVTIMQMDVGMDTGDYYEIETITIAKNDNAKTLHDKLAQLAVNPLIKTIHNFKKQTKLSATQQDAALVTYAPKINKDDAAIDWRQPAINIEHKVRAFNPWPLAFTTIQENRLQILEAETFKTNTNSKPGEVIDISKQGIKVSAGENALLIKTIKFPGKNAIQITDYLNSHNRLLQIGSILK